MATAPAFAGSPFSGVLGPIFGSVGHILPHRHWHHRHHHHVASHRSGHHWARRHATEHHLAERPGTERASTAPASQQPAEKPATENAAAGNAATGNAAAEKPGNVNTARAEPKTGGQGGAGGPLFWPQLADNVFDYVFWPSGKDDRFWAYGYNEIVEAALRPSGRESLRASGVARRRSSETTGSVADTSATCASQQGGESADSLVKHIESTVQPTDAQRAALNNLHTAAQHAFGYFDKACPKTRPQTPTARLDAMEDRIWAARQALLVMRAPVDKFYGTLSDAQKARLNAPSGASGETTAHAAGCHESSIDLGRMLMGRRHPDPKQRPGLEALQKTSMGLSRLLASSCPTTLPATPIDRLDTADRRLNSMLYAVVTLRAPLDALSSGPAQEPRVSGLRR